MQPYNDERSRNRLLTQRPPCLVLADDIHFTTVCPVGWTAILSIRPREIWRTAVAVGAIDEGVSLPNVADDIRGRPRPGPIDIGAWEFNAERGRNEQNPESLQK